MPFYPDHEAGGLPVHSRESASRLHSGTLHFASTAEISTRRKTYRCGLFLSPVAIPQRRDPVGKGAPISSRFMEVIPLARGVCERYKRVREAAQSHSSTYPLTVSTAGRCYECFSRRRLDLSSHSIRTHWCYTLQNGTRVFFWDSNGKVHYGTVQSTSRGPGVSCILSS